MNAIKLLKQQHEEVNGLFERLETAGGAGYGKKALFNQIADALAVHGELEERIFYPGVQRTQTEEILEHSLEEHLEVKKMIAELLDTEPTDAHFDELCIELKDSVLHVEEEEGELFPKVEKLIAADQLDEMGEEMDELASELKAESSPHEMVAMAAEQQPPQA